MCLDRCKTHGWGKKKQKALARLYLASGPLPNAANSSVVLTIKKGVSSGNEVGISPADQNW